MQDILQIRDKQQENFFSQTGAVQDVEQNWTKLEVTLMSTISFSIDKKKK
jgi:hypothetical protein